MGSHPGRRAARLVTVLLAVVLGVGVLGAPGAWAWSRDDTGTPRPGASGSTSEPTTTTEATTEPTPTTDPPPEPEPEPELVSRSVVVGTTARGRAIRAYYRGWTNVETTRTLLVLGQMHGDEKAGLRTASYLREHVKPRVGAEIWVIPTMNPDGNARGTRTNARGVDLNRNWPTSGWSRKGKGSRTWGGPSKGSERETKAMMAFLREHRPDYIASVHQPYGVVARNGHDVGFEKRLAKGLGLPRRSVGVGTPSGRTSPTLTGWYNRYLGSHGAAVTIEYKARVSDDYARKRAGLAITSAARVR